jgi:hypothetical protein
MSGPVENAYRFRAPRDLTLVRQDRRVDVVANSAGETGSVRSADLPPYYRTLFELQLAAYRTARNLVQACDIAVMTGMPVHEDMVAAWVTARRRWHQMRHELRISQKGSA